MASHRIHLRGPWEFSWIKSDFAGVEPVVKTGTIAMPQEWRAIFAEVAGTAEFRRKFHRPTNLEPQERVLIVFTEVRGTGNVRLNDLPVGSFVAQGESVEVEISTLMKPFNEITVEITFDPNFEKGQPGGIFGVVALEIQSL